MTKEEFEILGNIESLSADIRGRLIDIFTTIEALIDTINIKLRFDTEEEYNFFIEKWKFIPMGEKQKMFNICLDKYSKKYNKNLSLLTTRMNDIIEIRNQLAHWITDRGVTTCVKLYEEKKQIRLVKKNLNDESKNEYSYFDLLRKKELDIEMRLIVSELIDINNTIYEQSPAT